MTTGTTQTTQAAGNREVSERESETRSAARAAAVTRHSVHRATHKVVQEDQLRVKLDVAGGTLELDFPPPDRLAFYGGLAAAAVFGAISWPMAVVAGLGHALATDHNNRTLEAVGEAIEAV
jgi:hypothetical protein